MKLINCSVTFRLGFQILIFRPPSRLYFAGWYTDVDADVVVDADIVDDSDNAYFLFFLVL